MNYLSVCSGIEAATVAWHNIGWNPIGFSEIEKFPSQLLQHHYPHVTNYGDMTKYKEWKLNDTIGLLVGGTPCQSFSVAGLRKGLEDPRGNLMLTYLGIADYFKPKWILWENVPGVLSSNGGKDFACFLQGLAELGYGFAYRVLDAQHFGVPQRRRRVFVVGCLGNWRAAAKVLFESESLQRNITPSRQKREETSEYVADCVGTLLARDYKGIDSFDHTKMIAKSVSAIDLKDVSKTLTASYGMGGADLDIKPLVLEPKSYAIAENIIGRQAHNGGNGNGYSEEVMYTLNATGVHGVAIPINTMTCQGRPSDNGRMGLGIGKDGDPCPTLTEAHSHAVAFQQNTRDEVRYINGDGQIAGALMAEPGMKQQNYVMQSYGFEPGITKREGNPARFSEEISPTLRAQMGDNQVAVAIGVDTYNGTESGDVAVTMTAAGGSSTHSGPKVMTNNPIISWDSELNPNIDKMGTLVRGGQGGRMDGVMQNMAVRRLTPIECERLQGFPNSYTDIKPQGKPTPDGHRYKALGNSMAVPVMKWIGERINQYEKGEL
jgi:DNA (cytosine-5)-methyltransferase 1